MMTGLQNFREHLWILDHALRRSVSYHSVVPLWLYRRSHLLVFEMPQSLDNNSTVWDQWCCVGTFLNTRSSLVQARLKAVYWHSWSLVLGCMVKGFYSRVLWASISRRSQRHWVFILNLVIQVLPQKRSYHLWLLSDSFFAVSYRGASWRVMSLSLVLIEIRVNWEGLAVHI